MTRRPVVREPLRAGALAACLLLPGLAAAACVLPQVGPVAAWRLRPADTEQLPFHGIASFDAAGAGTTQMFYVVPGIAGLVAGVLAHGLVVNSARQGEKDRLQRQADDVLKPYDTVIASLTQSELRRRALQWLPAVVAAEDARPDAWTIEAMPVLALVANAAAVELDARIIVHRPAASPEASAQRLDVRVVGAAVAAGDREAFWNADAGERLRSASARLFAESVHVAIEEAVRPDAHPAVELPFKTVRYLEGDVERMERAQVLEGHCNRLLIRTLRGALMSVPQRPVPVLVPTPAALADEPIADASTASADCSCAPF